MNCVAICSILDITPEKLQELCAAGILKPSTNGRFDARRTVRAYCTYLHALLAGKGIDAVTASATTREITAGEAVSLERQKLEADVRIARAKAEQEEIKLDALGRDIRGKKEDEDSIAFKPLDTLTGISKLIGISLPALWKLAHGATTGESFPKSENGKHYNTRDVLRWYYQRQAARDTADLRKQELEEAVRLKRAKADLAEGKAVPVEDALSVATAVYEACWQTLEGVCCRGTAEEAEGNLRFARGEFQGLRKRIESLAPKNS